MQSMPASVEAPAYLTDRCCLTCGFRGRELQGRRGADRLTCPQCRQDLYSRPARSYAEMEGLAGVSSVGGRSRESFLSLSPGRRRLSLLRLAGGLLGRVGLLLGSSRSARVRRARRGWALGPTFRR